MSAQSHDIYSAAVYIQLGLAASISSLESHRHIWRREVSGITLLWFTTLVTVKRSNVNNIALASSDMPTQFMGMLKDWMAWRIFFCEFVICYLFTAYRYFVVNWYSFFVNCKTTYSIVEYYIFDIVLLIVEILISKLVFGLIV